MLINSVARFFRARDSNFRTHLATVPVDSEQDDFECQRSGKAVVGLHDPSWSAERTMQALLQLNSMSAVPCGVIAHQRFHTRLYVY